jgi:hypothetical protein
MKVDNISYLRVYPWTLMGPPHFCIACALVMEGGIISIGRQVANDFISGLKTKTFIL